MCSQNMYKTMMGTSIYVDFKWYCKIFSFDKAENSKREFEQHILTWWKYGVEILVCTSKFKSLEKPKISIGTSVLKFASLQKNRISRYACVVSILKFAF